MSKPLRHNTEQYVMFGPMMGLEGTTFMTGLTFLTSDIRFQKAGSTTLVGKTVDGVTHVSSGVYCMTLLTSDVDTYGPMDMFFNNATALTARLMALVMSAPAYDALYAAPGSGAIEANLTEMGGVAQSATDLKDFADAGYDPATNKVQGVVLVDTTTANTDMRGTDSAALATVCTEGRLAELDAANLPTDIANVPTVAEFNARTLAAAAYFDPAVDTVTVGTNSDKTGYSLSQAFPTNFASMVITAGGAVDALVQGYLNTLITETTAGRIAGNFDIFFENADAVTTKTVDDVGVAGSSLTQQQVRDAMKLTPTGGAPSVGSVDEHLDDILTNTADLQANQGNWLTATSVTVSDKTGFSLAPDQSAVTIGTVTANTDMRGTDGAATSGALATHDGKLDTANTHLTDIKGATFSSTTDSLEAIRNQGDTAWLTAVGFATTTNLATHDGKMDTLTTNVAALKDFDPATQTVDVGKMAGSAIAATNLGASAGAIVTGAAAAGTLSTTEMTTNLTEATDDHYKGRIIIWTSGVLKDQATDITAYVGASKKFTFTATTEAPSAADTFVVV